MAYKEFAKLYDELIYEDINYEKICLKITELCSRYNIKNTDYLDLACGTGNVSSILGKNFNNVYAVDLSYDMLDIAYEKYKKNKIKAKVICQDMTELCLNHTFDLITCVLDSTNYITENEDLKNYFLSVKKHLKDDGIFIFDINSYYKLSTIMGNNIFTHSSEDIFYTWENVFENDILNMYLTFFSKTENDLYERFEEEHYERAYKEEDIENLLNECDFEILNSYDGYSNNKNSKESERILYIVKKR